MLTYTLLATIIPALPAAVAAVTHAQIVVGMARPRVTSAPSAQLGASIAVDREEQTHQPVGIMLHVLYALALDADVAAIAAELRSSPADHVMVQETSDVALVGGLVH